MTLCLPRSLFFFAACLLALSIAACAGSEETTTDRPQPPPTAGEPAPEEPAPEDPAEERGPRTVQGFRIQVLTTAAKDEADAQAAEAEAWWQDLSADKRAALQAAGSLPVEVAWKAPYYRVQIGAFASREQAQQALQTAAARFPDAFLVPSRVTVGE